MQVYYQDRIVGEFNYRGRLNDSYIMIHRMESFDLDMAMGGNGPMSTLPSPKAEQIILPVKTRARRFSEMELARIDSTGRIEDLVGEWFRSMGVAPGEYALDQDFHTMSYVVRWKCVDLGHDADLFDSIFDLEDFRPV